MRSPAQRTDGILYREVPLEGKEQFIFIDSETVHPVISVTVKVTDVSDVKTIGMDNPSILRMMEDENLDAFKELLKVKNESILKRVEKTYCDIGMCNYSTILMMYKEESKAANQSLEW